MLNREGINILMIEKKYLYKVTDTRTIERIISDENADINHIVLQKGDFLPEHFSNSNVYLIIIRGIITIQLNEQKPALYPRGNIINIPYKVKMNIYNEDEDVLEFFIVKSPSPKFMDEGGNAK
jgi:quercetin dioxygenase-like cupin family protein